MSKIVSVVAACAAIAGASAYGLYSYSEAGRGCGGCKVGHTEATVAAVSPCCEHQSSDATPGESCCASKVSAKAKAGCGACCGTDCAACCGTDCATCCAATKVVAKVTKASCCASGAACCPTGPCCEEAAGSAAVAAAVSLVSAKSSCCAAACATCAPACDACPACLLDCAACCGVAGAKAAVK